ncbi:MAG: tRNA (guanosine(37)-N1)-methyltransferase TrmD [Dehalococcoidia bacterium]|nr:tRNA (guanosine(37)-N1)-methyltransferase TrmD [Dehalococcoidia bacterium]
MRIDILALFPAMFRGPFEESIVKRAVEKGLVEIYLHDIRDFAVDKHRTVDDAPFGGGPGMVMKPDPLFAAVESLELPPGTPVILLSPQGRLFRQTIAEELAAHERLVLICGHYEGVDERVLEHLVTDEISIGDYILTGGEIPAMVLVDAVVRLLPGALGSEESLRSDSLSSGLLQFPLYTRPADFRGLKVPDILLSGNHPEIARWRRRQSLLRTLKRRPDLLEGAELTDEEKSELGIRR